jgi:hypothetical protein
MGGLRSWRPFMFQNRFSYKFEKYTWFLQIFFFGRKETINKSKNKNNYPLIGREGL